ncbi:PfkB family carbohydrate kinase [Salinarimonas ramus]|uniref:Sulfofructose kinase n=1 Tax=Salinarimonas ramus TaxID=690164 RepID=A0A917Q590_9HYPH|nr:PfkB family carbohydrate kinase [Salinarimonas ramus]GGK24645.1 sulfofructose kinase [Salinarimonas ramus]
MRPRILSVGIATLDHVYKVAEMPTRAEKYRAQGFTTTTGGTAANAAIAMTRLGADATLFARLGEDWAGAEIVDRLTREGVDCSRVRRLHGFPSPISAIVVDAIGERLVVSHADPAMPREADWLPDALPEGTRAVLGDTRWQEGTAHLFRLARAAGVPAVLDADRDPTLAPEVLSLATHVAFSMQGLRDITGHTDARAALEAYRPPVPSWIAVTNGGEGLFWWSGERVEHMRAFDVPVVDTLAAGDIWHGAFTVRLAEGADEVEAARFASAAAAIKCTRFGGRDGAPTREEVEAFLAATSWSSVG